MPRYAFITPKEDATPPANTGHGWAFPFNSEWVPIGAGKPILEALALHAERWFTTAVPNGESVCSVDVAWQEGDLELRPVMLQEFPCPLCSEKFTDVSAFNAHVKECATGSRKAASEPPKLGKEVGR